MKLSFLVMLLLTLSLSAQAGPIASGGTPPTAFEFESEALTALLSPESQVRDLLRHSGRIQEIRPMEKIGSYTIITEKCAVQARYGRKCRARSSSPFPTCEPVVRIEKVDGACR